MGLPKSNVHFAITLLHEKKSYTTSMTYVINALTVVTIVTAMSQLMRIWLTTTGWSVAVIQWIALTSVELSLNARMFKIILPMNVHLPWLNVPSPMLAVKLDCLVETCQCTLKIVYFSLLAKSHKEHQEALKVQQETLKVQQEMKRLKKRDQSSKKTARCN